jgi:uncharacterized protein
MKFLVDWPLGGLVKWLRFCGFDATLMRLEPEKPGNWPPPKPHTHILTRQRVCQRLQRPDLLVLAATSSAAQLEEVLDRLHISLDHLKPLTRCSQCNDLLIPLDRNLAQGRVPEYVFYAQRRFSECPRCHRVYWPGSHLQGSRGILKNKLKELAIES